MKTKTFTTILATAIITTACNIQKQAIKSAEQTETIDSTSIEQRLRHINKLMSDSLYIEWLNVTASLIDTCTTINLTTFKISHQQNKETNLSDSSTTSKETLIDIKSEAKSTLHESNKSGKTSLTLISLAVITIFVALAYLHKKIKS